MDAAAVVTSGADAATFVVAVAVVAEAVAERCAGGTSSCSCSRRPVSVPVP